MHTHTNTGRHTRTDTRRQAGRQTDRHAREDAPSRGVEKKDDAGGHTTWANNRRCYFRPASPCIPQAPPKCPAPVDWLTGIGRPNKLSSSIYMRHALDAVDRAICETWAPPDPSSLNTSHTLPAPPLARLDAHFQLVHLLASRPSSSSFSISAPIQPLCFCVATPHGLAVRSPGGLTSVPTTPHPFQPSLQLRCTLSTYKCSYAHVHGRRRPPPILGSMVKWCTSALYGP